jgi:hypothetical protein
MEIEESSTEEKIMQSARRIFASKGYEGTKTREIAADAGVNLALLNYYFRSKEKLFQLVMKENMQQFLGVVGNIIHHKDSSLKKKLESLTANYIDMLLQHPELPLFVIGEIKHKPAHFIQTLEEKLHLENSVFFKQIKKRSPKNVSPFQVFINLLSMIIFPFVSRPLLSKIGDINNKAFENLMEERKKLIPEWIQKQLNQSE